MALILPVAGGDYRGALDTTNKQFSPSSKEQPGRYERLILKARCQLQLKDRTGACGAFKSAAKVAGNVNELAAAKANALIVDRSMSGRFTSRSIVGADPIEILPVASRKQAMLAQQADLWSQYNSQIDVALRSESSRRLNRYFRMWLTCSSSNPSPREKRPRPARSWRISAITRSA